jgi:hypothetical protein
MPPTPGFADGVAGNSVKLLVNGVPVFGLKNFNWKIARDKKPVFGAGFADAHGSVRSNHKTYEIDFEITELLVPMTALRAAMAVGSLASGELYLDPTDFRNGVIVLFYPGLDAAMSKTFTGVELVACDGGISDSEDAEAISIKCSGYATGMLPYV